MPLDPSSWQLLGQGLATWRDRRDRDADQKVERERLDRLDKLQAERDAINRQLIQHQLESSQFRLGEQKKTATAQDAISQFDPSRFEVTDMLPPDLQGPPTAPQRPDVTKPFHAQLPDLQQIILSSMAAKGVGAPQVIQQFNDTTKGVTGRPVMPQAPPGMHPSQAVIDGFTFEPKMEIPPDAIPQEMRVGNTTYGFPQSQGPAHVKPVLGPNGEEVPGLFTKPDGDIGSLPANRLTEGDKALAVNSSEIKTNLENLKKVIQDYGTFETALPFGLGSSTPGAASGKTSTEGSAVLNSLPYKIAIEFAKMVDPATAAREGEVEAAKKFLIPTGLMANNAQALSTIDEMLAEVVRRMELNKQLSGVGGSLSQPPQSAPTGVNAAPPTPSPSDPNALKFGSVAEFEAAQVPPGTVALVWDPATSKWRPARKK